MVLVHAASGRDGDLIRLLVRRHCVSILWPAFYQAELGAGRDGRVRFEK